MVTKSSTLTLLKEFLAIKENRFVVLTYRNQAGELSRYTVMIGAFLRKSYEKDFAKVLAYVPKNEVEKQAKEELLASLADSLQNGIGNNANYTKKGYYEHLTPNVKFNDKDEIFIDAFVLKREVIEKGVYKTVKSAPKTIAKNEIRKTLRSGKFREFKLNLNQIESVALNGRRFVVV